MWERISAWDGAAKITGILVNDYRDSDGYYNFGVADEPLPESTAAAVPTVELIERAGAYEAPGDNDRPKAYFHLTTGSLHDVASIQIRRESARGRCLGMRIVHSSGPDDVLGSWDPQDTLSISTLYDAQSASDELVRAGKVQSGLVFSIAESSGWIYVADIQMCNSTCGSYDVAMRQWSTSVRFSYTRLVTKILPPAN